MSTNFEGYKHGVSRVNKGQLGRWLLRSGRKSIHPINLVATSKCHVHTLVFRDTLVGRRVCPLPRPLRGTDSKRPYSQENPPLG